jgi:hypothetical protein
MESIRWIGDDYLMETWMVCIVNPDGSTHHVFINNPAHLYWGA